MIARPFVIVAALGFTCGLGGGTSGARVARVTDGRVVTRWPNGTVQRDVVYAHGAYEGEYRAWFENGHPFERRHYRNGHEDGLQQAWTDAGELYINYEVKDGRRYGLLNSMPCVTVTPDEHAKSGARAMPDERAEPGDGSTQGAIARADDSRIPYYDSPAFAPHWTPVAHQIAPFRMTAQTGAAVTDRTLDHTIYVASFIYTRCAAVCPLVVAELARVQQATRSFDDVRIVSYSVTPEDDTPTALAAFGKEHGVDPHRWLLLTGDRRDIYRLARTSYFADDSRVGSSDDFLHTEKIVLVDGNRHLRGVYNGTSDHEVDELVADIRALRANF